MLAATRTLLSHFRTTAVIISLAFAIMKLNQNEPIDAFTIILFVLSGLFLVMGFVDFFVTKYYIKNLFSDDNSDETDADNE